MGRTAGYSDDGHQRHNIHTQYNPAVSIVANLFHEVIRIVSGGISLIGGGGGPSCSLEPWWSVRLLSPFIIMILTLSPSCRWGLLYVPPGFGCISTSRLPQTLSSYVLSYSMPHLDTVGALCRGYILPRYVCPCCRRESEEVILFTMIDYAPLCACQRRVTLNCVSGLRTGKAHLTISSL
jgi:hypothetical protein